MWLYEKLAGVYGRVRDQRRQELYYKRSFYGLLEPTDGSNRFAAMAWMANQYSDNLNQNSINLQAKKSEKFIGSVQSIR